MSEQRPHPSGAKLSENEIWGKKGDAINYLLQYIHIYVKQYNICDDTVQLYE